jgi:fructose-specific phosphotransferase system component IIB
VYTHTEPPGVTLKVERGQRGGYGWEVRATAGTVPEALALICAADAALRAEFTADEKGA